VYRGQNFKRYDHDGSGEIDVVELRTALMEWAVFAQAETAKKAAKQRSIAKRKQELAAERLEMLRDADARAKEIMAACVTDASEDAEDNSITMQVLKSRLGGSRKFKPFVTWLLKVIWHTDACCILLLLLLLLLGHCVLPP
jgi:hypothetical protein